MAKFLTRELRQQANQLQHEGWQVDRRGVLVGPDGTRCNTLADAVTRSRDQRSGEFRRSDVAHEMGRH